MSGSGRSGDRAPEPDLRRVASLLQRHGVDCVLVGGMSARIYGSQLMTSDSDIVTSWSRASLEALCRALASVDAQIRVGVDDDGQDRFASVPGGLDADDVRHLSSFRVRTRDGDLIDVLRSIPVEPGADGRRLEYAELVEDALVARLGDDVGIRIVSREILIRSKRAVGRRHDLAAVRDILAADRRSSPDDP